MESDIVGKSFDYEDVLPAKRDYVRQRTTEIKDRMGRAAQNIVEIGTRLLEVKDSIPHGLFTMWLEDEFRWSESLARKMMSVATHFKTVNFTDLSIAPSALYMLASPSIDPEVREEVVSRASAGEKIERKHVIQAKAKRVESKPVPKPAKIVAPITPNPEAIEPDADDAPESLPEPVKPKEKTDADFIADHNGPIEAAIAGMETHILAIGKGMGHRTAKGESKLDNPMSAKFSSFAGTIGPIRDAIRSLGDNLIVTHPEKRGEHCSGRAAKSISIRLKAKGK